MMRLAEVVCCVLVVLVVTLTTGDGAPQWRPQGRFGKRTFGRSFYGESDIERDLEDLAFPVETLLPSGKPQLLRLSGRLCTLTYLPGFMPCFPERSEASERATSWK